MTKAEVKILVESDDKLQWWAAILFAEICELMDALKAGHDPASILQCVKSKVDEFPELVIQTCIEKVKADHAKTNQQTQDS